MVFANLHSTESAPRSFLESNSVLDWSDASLSHETNSKFLRHVASTPGWLRRLIIDLPDDPEHFGMCEVDDFRYKFVIYDGRERNFRLRLHVWKEGFPETVHGHRFHYTSLILNGGYRHTVYVSEQDLYPSGSRELPEKTYSATDPAMKSLVDVDKIKSSIIFSAEKGSTYTQFDQLLSSTVVYPDTVSLFTRGPAYRDSAFQWDLDSNTVIWRRGAATMDQAQHDGVRMTEQHYKDALAKLEKLGIV